MAGSISLSLSQQFDEFGKPLSGGKLYFIQAGTTSTPQDAFKDTGLSIPHPNPITLDAAGRVPAFYLADGQIKIRLEDANGVTQIEQDNLLVIGPSSGGGGGGGVDPTTIFSTGAIMQFYGTATLAGWVRANGRTIGSATSGASERANADCQSLFQHLWGVDPNLAVSGGRGASAAADWAANKTIVLPDARGRTLAGLDDMGAAAAGRLTASYFGTAATVLGAASTLPESRTLVTGNLPPYTPSGSVVTTKTSPTVASSSDGGSVDEFALGSASNQSVPAMTFSSVFTGTPQGGTSTPLSIIQPTLLATYYLKL